MLRQKFPSSYKFSLSSAGLATFVTVMLALFVTMPQAFAQSQQSTQGQQQQKPGQQQAPPEAGGPQGDIGPIAIPKKKDEPPPPPPPQPKAPEGMPNYSLTVDVPLVSVDALVLTKDGQFVPGIPKGNFKVLEDGVPQKIITLVRRRLRSRQCCWWSSRTRTMRS